jgi:hypothetical protein
MGMFGCFDGTIIGTWFDELMFGIGVTSLLRYFYNVQGTGRSAPDQICVTHVWCVHRWGRGCVILEIRKKEGFLQRRAISEREKLTNL